MEPGPFGAKAVTASVIPNAEIGVRSPITKHHFISFPGVDAMTSGISSLRILPREENGKENNREDEMLGLFLSMLDVRVQAIEANVGNDPHSQVILQELKAGISKLQAPGAGTPKLSNAAAWNEAYRLERLLAVVEPPETLTLDLDRRLNEAIANNLPAVERLKVDVSAAKSAAYDTSKQPPVLNPVGPKY